MNRLQRPEREHGDHPMTNSWRHRRVWFLPTPEGWGGHLSGSLCLRLQSLVRGCQRSTANIRGREAIPLVLSFGFKVHGVECRGFIKHCPRAGGSELILTRRERIP